jgi:hypothetical protein
MGVFGVCKIIVKSGGKALAHFAQAAKIAVNIAKKLLDNLQHC